MINKYGILIKKKLQEQYPKRYDELKEKGKLFPLVRDSQYEIQQYKMNLINENKTLLTKEKIIEILDSVNNSIDKIVKRIGNSKTGD